MQGNRIEITWLDKTHRFIPSERIWDPPIGDGGSVYVNGVYAGRLVKIDDQAEGWQPDALTTAVGTIRNAVQDELADKIRSGDSGVTVDPSDQLTHCETDTGALGDLEVPVTEGMLGVLRRYHGGVLSRNMCQEMLERLGVSEREIKKLLELWKFEGGRTC